MKGLKTILNNEDILTRFRLLQLWCIDVFTNSLKNNEPTLSKLINETMINADAIDDSPEHMLSVLIELKKEIEAYNTRLERINKIIEVQNRYAKILKSVDETIIDNSTNMDDIISRNKKLIDGINSLNINSISELI